MELQHYKAAVLIMWVLVACTLGIATGMTALPALALLVVLALVPPLVMMRLWTDPPQTIAESIHQARR
jgi:hypothetical protein